MKKLANDKGITLVALVVTIIILLILAAVTIPAGRNVIADAKLTAFSTEMEIMQQEVNKLYQKYKNGDTEVLELGLDLQQNNNEEKAFYGADEPNRTGYRYYNINTIEGLGLTDISQEFLVNVARRKIISLAGFKYRGEEMWTMAQLPSGSYNVKYEGIESSVTFNLSKENNSLIVSNIQYTGDVKKGTIYYGQGQNANSVDWKIAESNTTENSCKIEIRDSGIWYVKIIDSAGNESEIENISM